MQKGSLDLDTPKTYHRVELILVGLGRKLRYEHVELFDAGNVDDNGNLLTPDHPRSHYNKVSISRATWLE